VIESYKSRCQSQTKSGRPCRAAATAGGLCFFHANPKKASELGRLGGLRNRHVVAATATGPDPQLALDNARVIRDRLTRLITDLDTGKVQNPIVHLMPPILNLQLRAIETVAKLEDRVRATSGSRPAIKRERPDKAGEGSEKGTQSRLLEQSSALGRIASSMRQLTDGDPGAERQPPSSAISVMRGLRNA